MPSKDSKFEMFIFLHDLRVEELDCWIYANILNPHKMSDVKRFYSDSLPELLKKMIAICFENRGRCKSWENDDGAYITDVPKVTVSNLGENNPDFEILYSTNIEYVYVSKTYVPQIVYSLEKTVHDKQSGEITTKEISFEKLLQT